MGFSLLLFYASFVIGCLVAGANRIRFVWLKDMRTNEMKFYCIFEQIGYEAKGG